MHVADVQTQTDDASLVMTIADAFDQNPDNSFITELKAGILQSLFYFVFCAVRLWPTSIPDLINQLHLNFFDGLEHLGVRVHCER